MGGVPDFSSIDLSDFSVNFLALEAWAAAARRREMLPAVVRIWDKMELAFEEAVFGVEKELQFDRDETCSCAVEPVQNRERQPTNCTTCGGKGEVRQVRQTFLGSMVQVATCPACNGSGEDQFIPVRMPWARFGA